MIQHVRLSPSTRAALCTLLGRAIERVFLSRDVRVLRRLRDDAQRLEIRSADGERYSGVLVVHENQVTTGLVVSSPRDASVAPLTPGQDASLDSAPSYLDANSPACEVIK